MTVVAVTPRTVATPIGTRARTRTSARASTSAPTRASRSPLCSRAVTVSRAMGQPAVDLAAGAGRPRVSAVSWEANRSQYPSTPREMPKVRTATTATDRSSTGGICQARVISQAETPARASALPSASEPSAIANTSRGRLGRKQRPHRSDADMVIGLDGDDVVGDCHHTVPVGDHHDGGPLRRASADRLQHGSFGRLIQVGGGFVEQQDRRGGPECAGQPQPLTLAQRQARPRRGPARCPYRSVVARSPR